MKKSEKMYQKLVRWAENKGFKNIKVNMDGFERPSSFAKKNTEEVLIPDMTAQSYATKYFFEIAVKPKEERRVQKIVSKWKLLSTIAKIKGGQLFLLAPYGNKSFTKELIKDYHIEAKFLFLPQLKG